MPKRTLHALEYLQTPAQLAVPPVCVLFGDESLLKREVLAELRHQVLTDEAEFSFDVFSGDDLDAREVFDALSTLTLFGQGKRLVLVQQADRFVSGSRQALEHYAAQPAAAGILVLDVGTWAKGTRLYKQLAETGLQIECKTPPHGRLGSWLSARAEAKHNARLAAADADLMLQMIEPSLGLLDQQLARLALLAGPDRKITGPLIRDHVGSWRIRSTWDLVDAAAAGDAAEAFRQLERLLGAGEQPIAVLAQLASTLRRFAAATQLVDRAGSHPPRLSLALEQAGFPRFVLKKAEQQLRQLGRERARRLGGWLLDADVAMKGDSSAPPRQRLVLERLIVRLSTAADPRRAGTVAKPA